ncbi:MAG: acyl-CoA synthetase FdrA [Granulosicoccus sp.]
MSDQQPYHLETRVRQQFYLDSVALMRMSRSLTTMEGVQDAAMMMGTPANLEILSNAGLLESALDDLDDSGIGPGDLILTVRADSQAIAVSALDQAEQLLAQPQASGKSRTWQPRSISSAMDEHPEANLALISVAGAFAISEARKAIRRGLHAMIFSDNVPVEDELALKREARDLGVLVMGPDCGTCVINGVPLAFANQLPRGDIGIVGASGTGIQEVSCLLASMGKGISHAIGVGGRDMGATVGGISTLMALEALNADEATRHIIVICKPPAPEVAALVLSRITASSKTFTVCFIGGQSPELPANANWASTLSAAAENAGGVGKGTCSGQKTDSDVNTTVTTASASSKGRLIRGLFCGGTLCAEAQVICLEAGLSVSSNAAIPQVSAEISSQAHTLLDLGSDEYTQGKPHPMIDPTVRDQLLTEALQDADTAVILLDVVLGYGAHADPAGQLVQSLPEGWAAKGVQVIASVTGTEHDPQGRSRQVAVLQGVGIHVAMSNAHAALLAIAQVKTHSG